MYILETMNNKKILKSENLNNFVYGNKPKSQGKFDILYTKEQGCVPM